jgi:hypothetical protein
MWISLHPNVPPPNPNQGILRRVWRTLRMMIISLVAPELMLGFAARQYVVARWFSRSKKDSLPLITLVLKPYSIRRLTNTCIFLEMGGFVTRDGHHPIVILARPQLSQYLEQIGEIKEEDIINLV